MGRGILEVCGVKVSVQGNRIVLKESHVQSDRGRSPVGG